MDVGRGAASSKHLLSCYTRFETVLKGRSKWRSLVLMAGLDLTTGLLPSKISAYIVKGRCLKALHCPTSIKYGRRFTLLSSWKKTKLLTGIGKWTAKFKHLVVNQHDKSNPSKF